MIGGSIAGLVTARVLSDHFDQVTVIERDAIPDDLREPRRGVPPSPQAHLQLRQGDDILSDLFPGLVSTLVEAGAARVDMGRDLAWYHFDARKAKLDRREQFPSICLTRAFLEAGFAAVSLRRPMCVASMPARRRGWWPPPTGPA